MVTYERIACTGGSGALGSIFVENMTGFANLTVVDRVLPTADVQYSQADITDYKALRAAFEGQEAVVHLAAISNPRLTSPMETFRVNVVGTWAVMQAAEDAGVRKLVVASSDATSGLLYNPPNYAPHYLPVDESHALRPTESYSLSKEITETISRSYYHRGKMSVTIIRPCHIVFPQEYDVLREKGEDPDNYHLWTYVSPHDVSQALRLTLDVRHVGYDTFFISAATGLNTRPTLEMLEERYGMLPEIRRPEIFEQEPTASILDISHARAVLGYEPAHTWHDMVATLEGGSAA